MGTRTTTFGAGRREAHDASAFYDRFSAPLVSTDDRVAGPDAVTGGCFVGDSAVMAALPDASVALVVTSPPYFVGKDYEEAISHGDVPGAYVAFLSMLRDVFAECTRVLEPGGRIAVNVANLGRKPYRSLAADVVAILQDDLGLLLRGEVVWVKAEGASGSCAWGSFRSPSNPVLRDTSERVVIASKGRFDRAHNPAKRRAAGLPNVATSSNDEFLDATLDVWRIPPESARRVGHPAPFPVELPERLIHLYTYVGDVVLDPFLGSGSTMVAAARTGRIGVGYDLDPAYVELAKQRVAAEQSTPSPNATTLSRATATKKQITAVAHDALEGAGFVIDSTGWKPKRAGLAVDFVVVDATGERWFVDVTGAFTVVPAGLARIDAAWRAVGRSAVMREHGLSPVLLLTSHLPPRGTEPDLAIRGAGPAMIFDVVPLLDDAGATRLREYATRGALGGPLRGFWPPA